MSRHVTFRFLAAGALLALLAACATTPGGPGPASEGRAERLLRQGNHAEAARMYEELAGNNAPPARDQFALAATRAWLDANRADDAQRALALASAQLPADIQFERDLLGVEVAAARGQYQAAWQQVSRLQEPSGAQDAARLFYLRQQVAVRAGETRAAVQAEAGRERVAADEAGRNRARRDLLSDLRGAFDRGQRIDPSASADALERGWLELAQIASNAGRSPMSTASMVERWRQRFPGHPASTIVASEVLDPAARTTDGSRPSTITGPVALLLPLSNREFGAEAALVRDGFQAAALRQPGSGLTDVRIYDTAAMSVGAALRAATADGATFIVGPLTKDEAQTAVDERPPHIPVLLLNSLPGGTGEGTWQYALAPEDEARQIARQIAGTTGRSAVVLTPAGDWGQRVAAAFTDELRRAGGHVLAEGVYPGRSTVESTLTAALGLDASRTRRTRVESAIGSTVQFEVRPTPGIDAIFVAGTRRDEFAMRQVRPYLRQYNAGDIPTYMTSDAVTDERAANRDLEGTRLLQMPWTLDTVGTASDVRLATQGSWGARTAREASLFAFGYDAATLAAALRRGLSNWPLDGVTGRLNLTREGRIERQLDWARVRDGAVQPADPLSP